jgi:RimJ/RimL family protein N-acetyltransferase
MSEINRENYYWKNSFIQLRLQREEDWENRIDSKYDSEQRFYLNDDIELPVDADIYRQWHIDLIQKHRSESNPNSILLAIENSDGEHVGACNIWSINERHGIFGPVGIEINTAYRNKGYGTAALRMIGNYMFKERRMHKWNSGYVEGNAASAAMHKRLGFIIEGIRPDSVYHDGKYWGEVLCGITEMQFFENEKSLLKL